jgi:hypothetical protein
MIDHGSATECGDERGDVRGASRHGDVVAVELVVTSDMGIKATAGARHWGQVEALCEDQHWVSERFLEIMTATWPEGMSTGPASGDAPAPRRYPPRVRVGGLWRPRQSCAVGSPAGRVGPPLWARAVDIGARQRSPPQPATPRPGRDSGGW